jgi:hypothetical protein
MAHIQNTEPPSTPDPAGLPSVGMTGMADLIERKSLKLLAQAGQVLNQMVSEDLCDEPSAPHPCALNWAKCASSV